MSFTYNANPQNSDRDRVRLLVSDTDSNNYFLEDSEIHYFLSQQSSVIDAAIRAAEAIAGQFAKKADRVDAEEVSANYREQSKRYWELAEKLEGRKSKEGSGLKSVSTGSTLFEENNAQFNIGIHDNNEIF